ncbi:hypothetical protein CPB85DRAFT_1264030 [Mucidula mucida]|nr:hypothetical protein CPB85DRAFT_1264030 [Mucidula mucida]
MSRRYGTRGVKVHIDPSLMKSTRTELNEARKKKQDKEAEQKRIQDEAAEADKAKARRGRRRIGAALDAQANTDQSFNSLRPDLVVAESIAQTEDKPTPAAVQPLQPSTTSNSLTSAPSHDEEGIPRDDIPDKGGLVAESSMDIEEEPYHDPLLLPMMPPETESEGSLYAGDIDMGGTSSELNDNDGEDDDEDGPSGLPLNPNYDSDASDMYEDDGVNEDSEDEMQEDDELDEQKKGKGKWGASSRKGNISIPNGMSDAQAEKFAMFLKWEASQAAKTTAAAKRKEASAKKKDAKTAARHDIDAHRSLPAKAPVKSVTVGSKRKDVSESGTNTKQPKQSRKNEIGGLPSDWRKTMYHQQSKAAVSTTLLGEAIEPPGEFDQLKSKESLAAAQASKSSNKEAVKPEGTEDVKAGSKRRPRQTITIVPADVKEIDGKEREKVMTVGRTSWKNAHLPFASTAKELPIWQKNVMGRIIDFAATGDNFFSCNSLPNLPKTVRAEWVKSFPHLPVHATHNGETIVRADHPAIFGMAQVNLQTYRSVVGAAGPTSVNNLWTRPEMQVYNTPALRKEWVHNELQGTRWFWGDPDARTGPFQGPLVLEVFSYHVGVVLHIPVEESYGDPIYALTLAAISVRMFTVISNMLLTLIKVKRGLMMWRTGVCERKRTAGRNSTDSFKDIPWGAEAVKHLLPQAKALADDDWADIFEMCEAILEAKKDANKPSASAADAENEEYGYNF